MARPPSGEGNTGAWEHHSPDEPDDALLVAAAQSDRRAFGPLYDRYARVVYRYCYARLGSPEAAEDATAEVFIKALAALNNYRHQTFAGWLFRIAQHVTIDALRARRAVAPLTAAEAIPDPARPPDELTLARDAAYDVRVALAALPSAQRSLIELQLAGCTGSEIATALARSPEAVRMLRLRAFMRLRALLSTGGEGQGNDHA